MRMIKLVTVLLRFTGARPSNISKKRFQSRTTVAARVRESNPHISLESAVASVNIPPLSLLTMQLPLQTAGIMRDDLPGAFRAGAFCPFWSPHGSKKVTERT